MRTIVHLVLLHGPRLARLAAIGLLLLAIAIAVFVRGGAVRHASEARRAAWAAAHSPASEQAASRDAWQAARDRVRRRHAELVGSDRAAARRLLDTAIGDELAPAWVGTRYSFSGQSRRPFSGSVACGHWITALLEDAAIPVDPDLGALASARIVRTLAGRDATTWLSDRSPGVLVNQVRSTGDGLYLLGLDTHVGLLRVRGSDVDFCHAAGSWPRAVLCEPAGSSPSLRSRVHVWGPLLSDRAVDAWLTGTRLPTAD